MDGQRVEAEGFTQEQLPVICLPKRITQTGTNECEIAKPNGP